MRSFIRELLEELLGSALEDFLSPKLHGCVSEIGWHIFPVMLITFCYSGFSDYEHYSSRGARIFLLPGMGIALAWLLYVLMWRGTWMVDSPTGVAIAIAVPYFIPLALMIWTRQQDLQLTGNVLLVFAGITALVAIFGWLLERSQDWPRWVQITTVLLILAIGYLASHFTHTRPQNTRLDKYEPLEVFRRLH